MILKTNAVSNILNMMSSAFNRSTNALHSLNLVGDNWNQRSSHYHWHVSKYYPINFCLFQTLCDSWQSGGESPRGYEHTRIHFCSQVPVSSLSRANLTVTILSYKHMFLKQNSTSWMFSPVSSWHLPVSTGYETRQ